MNHLNVRVTALAAALCGSLAMFAVAEEKKTVEVQVKDIKLVVPMAWKQEEVTSRFRVAQFKIDPTEGDKEAAELVISDDNFSTIVAGIEEGRIAYDNVRKVIYLLVSTGAAELVLVGLSVLAGLPLPLGGRYRDERGRRGNRAVIVCQAGWGRPEIVIRVVLWAKRRVAAANGV